LLRRQPATRRDVLLYEDAGVWPVEARQSAGGGRRWWYQRDSQDAAEEVVRRLLDTEDRWREL
jgi:hypothetical protein